MPSYRRERLETLIGRELSIILQHSSDELLSMVTVTQVHLTRDFSIATCHVSIFNDKQAREAMEALQRATGYLRSQLAKVLEIRKTPELRFKRDESFAYGNQIDEILRNI